MNLYRVLRPHAAPSMVLIVANSKRHAITMVNKIFGEASNTRAVRLLLDRARIIAAGVDPAGVLRAGTATAIPKGKVN